MQQAKTHNIGKQENNAQHQLNDSRHGLAGIQIGKDERQNDTSDTVYGTHISLHRETSSKWER